MIAPPLETVPVGTSPDCAVLSVSLIEDAPDYRETLTAVLTSARDLVLLDACATGEEALEAFVARPPQVALIDLHLPGLDGVECIRRLRARLATTAFVVLTSSEA